MCCQNQTQNNIFAQYFMKKNFSNSRLRFLLLAVFVIANATIAIAQSNAIPQAQNVARQEFDAKDGYVNEQVYQMGEDGLMMTSRSNKAEDGEFEYKYSIIGTNLSEGKEVSFAVSKKFGLSSAGYSFLSATHFHRFLYNRNEFIIHSIARNANAKNVEVGGEFGVSGFVTGITVLQDQLVLAVKTKAGPTLVFINWKSGESFHENIPLASGDKPKGVSILAIQEMSNIGELAVILGIRKSKTLFKRWSVRYNAAGNKMGEVDITPSEASVLIDVKISAVSKTKFIYSGTYSKLLSSRSITAQGFFFSESDASTLKYTKFNNFLDLNNFLDFLPAKKQARIEKRQERAAEEGRELSYNYLMTVHPIVSTTDGYFLVGEAFYPEYHTETYYVNGKPQTRRVFDGYQYTHAIVVKFDINGERKMDQCLPMRLIDLPMTVVQNISLNVSVPNQITLSYANDRYLVSKTFNAAGGEIEKKQFEMLGSSNEDEKIRNSTATLRHWYGPYFIAYGFQTIKSVGSGKRRVFYINKMQI